MEQPSPQLFNFQLSNLLKTYVTTESVHEFFLDKNELYVLPILLSKIGDSADAFLVSTDPFDDYGIVAMSFSGLARLICKSVNISQDLRVFGSSWAVGISSYSANNQGSGESPLSLDDLEIKISLIGSAIKWSNAFGTTGSFMVHSGGSGPPI